VRSADSEQKGVADDDDHAAAGARMTLTEHALQRAVIERGATNRLAVGLPWFRSMPYSSITAIELHVDDEPVHDVRLEVDGRPIAPSGPDAAADYWFLQDRHELAWSGPVPAERARVVLRMRLQLPNLTLPDGSAAQVLQEVRAEVPVRTP
jgi:hypothetical protein